MTNINDLTESNQIPFKEILSKNPYFDNFTNESSFYKILFRNDRPLQTRELNQLQSILQKQIERLGSVVFKNGSIVSGCENKINLSINSATLQTEYSLEFLDFFSDQYIIAINNVSKIGKVVTTLHSSKNEKFSESLIFYDSISGSEFVKEDELAIYYPETKEINANFKFFISNTRKASYVIFNDGIIFINGYFLYIPKQKKIIDAYSNKPSKSLGFAIIDSIVTTSEDVSLFDNAYYEEIDDYTNNKTFGADRYKIIGNLDVRNILTDNNYAEQSISGNFFEFIRIESGRIVKNITTTIYSEVEKILARRTNDESGSYTVKPFTLKVKKSTQDLKNFTLEISPGKAYVLGYEFDSISTRYLEIPRALDFETKESFDFSLYYGSYIKLNIFTGFFNVQKCCRIYLCNKLASEYNIPTKDDIIGTARVKHCRKLGDLLFVYLFDIEIISGNFEQVKSIKVQIPEEGNGSGSLETSKLFDANNSSFIYKLNDQIIKSLDNASFSYQKVFLNQKFISSIDASNLKLYFNITVSSSEQINTNPLNYIIVNKTTNQYLTPSKVTILDELGQNGLLEVLDIEEGFFADILAIIDIKNASSRKAKEVTKTITHIISEETNFFNFGEIITITGVFLGFKLISVFLVKVDITNLFEVIENEDDNYISEIQIKYIGVNKLTKNIEITYIFLDFSPSGYFDLNSIDLSSKIVLPDILLSNKTILNRKNCLDFRPVKNANNEIDNAIIPSPSSTFECSYSFYLSRQDKLVVTSAKTFEIISGIPALNPNIVADSEEKMTLYSLFIPAGTDNPDLVKATFYENKRYTMRDIGKLEQRIENLEYYTTLTLLEKDIESFEIKDTSGNNRFKNGFLVDNFKNFKSLDYSNPDVNCSYDLNEGLLRPSFDLTNIKAVFNEEKSNAILAGELIILPYQSVPFIQQLQCSEILNLQPFEVFNWDGVMTLDPEIDEWIDMGTKPSVSINHFGENDIWEEIGEKAFKAEWKSWETKIVKTNPELPLNEQTKGEFANITTTEEMRLWNPSVDNSVGSEYIDAYNDWVNNNFQAGFDKTSPDGYVNGIPSILMPFKSATELVVQTGDSLAFKKSKLITNTLGENGVSIIPFIRAQEIKFYAKNLKPNIEIFAFFDNTSVTELCFQDNRYYSGLLRTNEKGEISGVFKLPGGVFNCGSRIFKLCDDKENNNTFITSVCERKFTANGLTQTRNDSFLSTREPQLTKVDRVSIADKPKSVFAWGDLSILPTPTPSPTPSTSLIPIIPDCSITATDYDPFTASVYITSNGTWGIYENTSAITVNPTWGVAGTTEVKFSGPNLPFGGNLIFRNSTLNCSVSVFIDYPECILTSSGYNQNTGSIIITSNGTWTSTTSSGVNIYPIFGDAGTFQIIVSGTVENGKSVTFTNTKYNCTKIVELFSGGGNSCIMQISSPYNPETKKVSIKTNGSWSSVTTSGITLNPNSGNSNSENPIEITVSNVINGGRITFTNTTYGCDAVVIIADEKCISITSFNASTGIALLTSSGSWEVYENLNNFKITPLRGDSGTNIPIKIENIITSGLIIFKNIEQECETSLAIEASDCSIFINVTADLKKANLSSNGSWEVIEIYPNLYPPGDWSTPSNPSNPYFGVRPISGNNCSNFELTLVGTSYNTIAGVPKDEWYIIFKNTEFNCTSKVNLISIEKLTAEYISNTHIINIDSSFGWICNINISNTNIVLSVYESNVSGITSTKVEKCLLDTTITFKFHVPNDAIDENKSYDLFIPKFESCDLTCTILNNIVSVFSITNPWKIIDNPDNIKLSKTFGNPVTYIDDKMVPVFIKLTNLPKTLDSSLTFATIIGDCQYTLNIPKTTGIFTITNFVKDAQEDSFGTLNYKSNGPVILDHLVPQNSILKFIKSTDENSFNNLEKFINIKDITIQTTIFLKNTEYNLVKSFVIKKPCILNIININAITKTFTVEANDHWKQVNYTFGRIDITPKEGYNGKTNVKINSVGVEGEILYFSIISGSEVLCSTEFKIPQERILKITLDGNELVVTPDDICWMPIKSLSDHTLSYNPHILFTGGSDCSDFSLRAFLRNRNIEVSFYIKDKNSTKTASIIVPIDTSGCDITASYGTMRIKLNTTSPWTCTTTGDIKLSYYSGPACVNLNTYQFIDVLHIGGIFASVYFRNDPNDSCYLNLKIYPTLNRYCVNDPLAQSFTIEQNEYPEGILITGFDLFFKTKSNTKPVKLELRQIVNGFPHSNEYIPFAQKIINSEEVFISNDASIPTNITFDSPIYLLPGEFAFCVISDSSEYNIFISKLGGYVLGSATERINKNAYSGVLFKSANSTTWLPQPELDFKFVIYRASFPTNQNVSVNIVNDIPTDNLNFSYNSLCLNAVIIKPANTEISIPKHNLIQENLSFSDKEFTINFNESSELENTFIIKGIN